MSERKIILFYEITVKSYENLIHYVSLLKHIVKDGHLILFALHKYSDLFIIRTDLCTI